MKVNEGRSSGAGLALGSSRVLQSKLLTMGAGAILTCRLVGKSIDKWETNERGICHFAAPKSDITTQRMIRIRPPRSQRIQHLVSPDSPAAARNIRYLKIKKSTDLKGYAEANPQRRRAADDPSWAEGQGKFGMQMK